MEIPQTVISQGNKPPTIQKETTNQKRRREDATAVATTVVQGMVWLHPSYTPLEALAAMNNGTLLSPPTIPEMDMEGYKSSRAVRDFPIDWTVLTENILDPDHGMFAHSSSGAAKGFDWYSADGSDNVMTIDEEFSSNGGYRIISSVNAVEKLIEYNRDVRSSGKKEGTKQLSKQKQHPPKLATSTYTAPSLISLGRRENSTSPSNFVTAFWVCPVGAGRSRFMSAAVGKTPFSIPRWMVHINLNNFLDQDTFLLLGQHRQVLKREAEGYLQMRDEETTDSNDVRKSTYVYRSPSEKLPVRLGQFFDATLARVPNRREGVMAWYNKNVYNQKLLEPWPQREQVLDRYEQHTKVCPDSSDVVRRCDKVIKRSKVIGFSLLFMRMMSASSGALSMPTSRIPIISGIQQGVFRFATALLQQNKLFYTTLGLAYLLHNVASRIKKEFFFKFNDELHQKDIKYIAKNWKDL